MAVACSGGMCGSVEWGRAERKELKQKYLLLIVCLLPFILSQLFSDTLDNVREAFVF